MKRRAIISVSDKTGVVELAKDLVALDFEIVSTGGTFQAITGAGVPATYVTEVTGFPEVLGGRVKTLHPFIHGGILAMRNEEHLAQLKELGIQPIDLVVVNLYPFRQTIAKEGVTLAEAIENIDIGGPSMVRAAAKNHKDVLVVVNPNRYGEIVEMLKKGEVDYATRLDLAQEAFRHTAEYDTYISKYLQQVTGKRALFPETALLAGTKRQELRYGENPHQQAAFYRMPEATGACVANAKKLQGKELSFNNIVDIHAALELVREFPQPAAVVIKHTNPCGVAIGKDGLDAYCRAFAADPVSAFGGIVGINRVVDGPLAEEMVKTFLEAVIAPAFTEEALAVFAAKPNVRLLSVGDLEDQTPDFDLKKVGGGFLIQNRDDAQISLTDLQVVSDHKPDETELEELLFAWRVVKHVKSNAIVVCRDKQTVGVGAGQMNRVGAAEIAFREGGEKCQGAVLASDAFFPFRDTVDAAAKAGIKAIIQPGGSVRDAESIAAANDHGIAMVFTGVRHFKH